MYCCRVREYHVEQKYQQENNTGTVLNFWEQTGLRSKNSIRDKKTRQSQKWIWLRCEL